jgi:hypothetical protein
MAATSALTLALQIVHDLFKTPSSESGGLFLCLGDE